MPPACRTPACAGCPTVRSPYIRASHCHPLLKDTAPTAPLLGCLPRAVFPRTQQVQKQPALDLRQPLHRLWLCSPDICKEGQEVWSRGSRGMQKLYEPRCQRAQMVKMGSFLKEALDYMVPACPCIDGMGISMADHGRALPAKCAAA